MSLRSTLGGPWPLALSLALPIAATAQNLKLGYVDYQRALLEVDEGKAAKARLQKWLDDRQKEIDKEQEALRKEKETPGQAGQRDERGHAHPEGRRAPEEGLSTWPRSGRSQPRRGRQQRAQEMEPIFGKMDPIIAQHRPARRASPWSSRRATRAWSTRRRSTTSPTSWSARYNDSCRSRRRGEAGRAGREGRSEEVASPDRRAIARRTPRRLGELAAHVGGELLGDAGLLIHGLNGLAEAGPGELSFYGNTQLPPGTTRPPAPPPCWWARTLPSRQGLSLDPGAQPAPGLRAASPTLFHPPAPRGRA